MKTHTQKQATQGAKIKLKQLVAAARAAGAEVTVSLGETRMPMRLPNDPPDVTLLLDESERCSALGNSEVSEGGPLTSESTETRTRPSLD